MDLLSKFYSGPVLGQRSCGWAFPFLSGTEISWGCCGHLPFSLLACNQGGCGNAHLFLSRPAIDAEAMGGLALSSPSLLSAVEAIDQNPCSCPCPLQLQEAGQSCCAEAGAIPPTSVSFSAQGLTCACNLLLSSHDPLWCPGPFCILPLCIYRFPHEFNSTSIKANFSLNMSSKTLSSGLFLTNAKPSDSGSSL